MGEPKTFTIDECKALVELARAEAANDRECELENAAKIQDDIADAMEFLLSERGTVRDMSAPFVMLPIPVSAAKDIAEGYGYDQVIILGRRVSVGAYIGGEHLTTYGGSDEHSNAAAAVGYHLRTIVFGWQDPGDKSRAVVDVLDECARQVTEEGFTAEHDDQGHYRGQLAEAAACYCMSANGYEYLGSDDGDPPMYWPFAASWWKPKDRYRDLVRAGALIIKELERLNRAAKKGGA